MKTMILTLSLMLLGTHSSFAANKCLTAVGGFKWPADNKPADMDNLSEYSKKILGLGKLKKKKVETGSVNWTGPDKITYLYVGQHNIPERFSESSLSYHQERGRNPIDVTIWTFMNLGMDQGIDVILNYSTSGAMLMDSALNIPQARTAAEVKQRIQKLVKAWNEIENGSFIEFKKNPVAKKLIAAAAEMMSAYYQTEKSPAEIRNALEKITPLAYEQGKRVWLDSGRGSHIRMLVGFLERYESQLDKTSQENRDAMILTIQDEARNLIKVMVEAN
jgi:hypothetical protein